MDSLKKEYSDDDLLELSRNEQHSKMKYNQMLLWQFGRFSLTTRAWTVYKKYNSLGASSQASFQINRKLFLCGGLVDVGSALSHLYTIDEVNQLQRLAPIPQKRDAVSLCGLSYFLVALGGCNQTPLSICDLYSIESWTSLPPLLEPKYGVGSVMVESKRVFCFCGTRGRNQRLHSVQSF